MILRCKKIVSLIIVNLCVINIHAQVITLADTLGAMGPGVYSRIQSERNPRTTSDSFYFYTYKSNRVHFVQRSMIQLLADTVKTAGILEIKYENKTKNIRIPGDAYQSDRATLYTEGFATIGKVKVMGKFYFDKVWDDSLSNRLSGQRTNGMPFTYFAAKAGNYERQNILFQAGAGVPIVHNLQATTLLNYEHYWSSGSVDPRPEEKLFTLKVTPGLVYTHGKTTLGAGLTFGKIDGTYDIVYKNDMYRTSQLYPERRLYINNGYGYIAQYISEAYSESLNNVKGWNIGLATAWKNWQLKVYYVNDLFEQRNFNRITNTDSVHNPVKERIYSRYRLSQQELNILLANEGENRVHQLLLDGRLNEGTGTLNSSPGGASYLFDEHNASFNYLLSLKKDGRLNAEWGINGAIMHFTRRDFLSQHFFENTRGDFSVQGGKYLYGKNHRLKITAQPGLIIPIANSLHVPETQVNVFTRSIAYPEYDFRGSTFFTGRLGIVYYSPSMLRLAGSAVFLNINYLQKFKDSDIDRSLVSMYTGKKQFNISLGFQIFL